MGQKRVHKVRDSVRGPTLLNPLLNAHCDTFPRLLQLGVQVSINFNIPSLICCLHTVSRECNKNIAIMTLKWLPRGTQYDWFWEQRS